MDICYRKVFVSIIATTTVAVAAAAAIATEEIPEAFFECLGLPIDDSAVLHDVLHVLLRGSRFHLTLLQDPSIENVIKCGIVVGRIFVGVFTVFLVNEMTEHGRLHEPFEKQAIGLR